MGHGGLHVIQRRGADSVGSRVRDLRAVGVHHGEVVVIGHAGGNVGIHIAEIREHRVVELLEAACLAGGAIEVVARQQLIVVLRPVECHLARAACGVEYGGLSGSGVDDELEALLIGAADEPVVALRATALGAEDHVAAGGDGGDLRRADPLTGILPLTGDHVIGEGRFAAVGDGGLDGGIHVAVITDVDVHGLPRRHVIDEGTAVVLSDLDLGDEGIDHGQVVVQLEDRRLDDVRQRAGVIVVVKNHFVDESGVFCPPVVAVEGIIIVIIICWCSKSRPMLRVGINNRIQNCRVVKRTIIAVNDPLPSIKFGKCYGNILIS